MTGHEEAMYRPQWYAPVEKARMAEKITEDGFHPLFFADPPGTVYPRHTHPETKLLAFVSGKMAVSVGQETYQCSAGDRLIIPGHVAHAAVVGPEGCTFFWSEKLDS